ncbi:MAG: YbgA family protein, partial [bacterium]
SNNINTLMHALGYFSKKVPPREKKYFLGMLEKYRNKRVMLPVPVGILRGWVYRFEEPYLMGQTFFEPYPEELVEIFDSGRGREIGGTP